jgi:hypothetical protein
VNTEHPITPPTELVRQWSIEAEDEHQPTVAYSMVRLLAAKAAQWGADQELEACCQHVDWVIGGLESKELRTARRPKPPSLKEQALGALGRFNTNAHTRADEMAQDFDLIRRALEAQ